MLFPDGNVTPTFSSGFPFFSPPKPKVTNDSVSQSGTDNDPEVLVIHNVTEKDEGWYTCIAQNNLGNTFNSAYLRVVECKSIHTFEVDINLITQIRQQSTALDEQRVPLAAVPQKAMFLIVSGVMIAFSAGCLGLVLWFLKRLKSERIKKLMAIETARAAVVTQWTKKVIVEKQSLANGQNVQEALLMPIVKIEKQKSTVTTGLGEDSNGGGSISEYELPLDSAWELGRDNLALGNTLGEGAFGKVIKARTNAGKPGIPSVVAVKMLKGGCACSRRSMNFFFC